MGAGISPGTFAAAPARANEQEIIVTAQKREQSIMDVGVAVTAFSGEALRSQGMQDFAAIANQVPNFTVSLSRGAIPDFSIRGVSGDGNVSRLNESTIAVYIDEVSLGEIGRAHVRTPVTNAHQECRLWI